MPDLNALLTDVAEVDVRFGSETVHVVFHPNASVSLDELADARIAEEDGDVDAVADATAEMAVRLIKSWDLTIGGEPLPVDLSSVRKIPVGILQKILVACREASQPGNRGGTPRNSNAGISAYQMRRPRNGRR